MCEGALDLILLAARTLYDKGGGCCNIIYLLSITTRILPHRGVQHGLFYSATHTIIREAHVHANNLLFHARS